MGSDSQFLLIDVNGRVYVSNTPQEYVGVVAVRTIIDLQEGKEFEGAGVKTPIRAAPPAKPPLTWDD